VRVFFAIVIMSLLSGCATSLPEGRPDEAHSQGSVGEVASSLRGGGDADRDSQGLSLGDRITQQLRPHWHAPLGAGTHMLETVLRWELNPDGSLRGEPRIMRQLGVSEENAAFAEIHAQRAISAVYRAQPFELPSGEYARWRLLEWTFDQRF
jgi:periplasmic protein TonB